MAQPPRTSPIHPGAPVWADRPAHGRDYFSTILCQFAPTPRFLTMRFGQPNPFLVLHAPSGIIKSQQLVALIRSLSLAFTRREALYRRELSVSARAPLLVRAPCSSSIPCLTIHTPFATTAKEVLNNLVYSTPSAPLFLENRSGNLVISADRISF